MRIVMNKGIRGFQKQHLWKKGCSPICLFLLGTALLMAAAVVWVYHVRVLNAPKVYSDGFGYYLYLPATFIYHDFSFSFIEGWEHPFDLRPAAGGVQVLNKYAVGTAIMESPFFLAAHVISLLRDLLMGTQTATGYSNLYQYAVLFGGICYWVLGTGVLYRLLCKFFHFSEKTALGTCALITFGTNLFHYASYDACFSHVYSYTLFSLFLYYLCWYEQPEQREKRTWWQTCVFGLLAGLIFMVRNTNIVFVLLYVFWEVTDWETFQKRFAEIIRPGRSLPIVLTGCITILPQLIYWKIATGSWFVYSYGENEPFYWLTPAIGKWLFSARKGLFFWTPMLLLTFLGIWYAARQKMKNLYGFLLFLIVISYLSSAWWSWWYGGSYGQRVAVDFMCVFAVFIAYALSYAKERGGVFRAAVYGFTGCCVGWNVICMLAYWYRILPSDGATLETVAEIVHWIL